MRYFSDELKQFFDTEESLLAAEETARQKQESAKATKAKYAKAVEDAEAEIDAARKAYDDAEAKVAELQKEYDEKVKEIMDPAVQRYVEAKRARATAIKEFNDKYGTYTTTYTGNDALNELEKFTSRFEKLFHNRFFF